MPMREVSMLKCSLPHSCMIRADPPNMGTGYDITSERNEGAKLPREARELDHRASTWGETHIIEQVIVWSVNRDFISIY